MSVPVKTGSTKEWFRTHTSPRVQRFIGAVGLGASLAEVSMAHLGTGASTSTELFLSWYIGILGSVGSGYLIFDGERREFERPMSNPTEAIADKSGQDTPDLLK